MQTVSADMANSLRTEAATLARCARLTRRDGLELLLTDHDRDITVGAETFRSLNGFTATALVASSTSFSSQQTSITVNLTNDGVREDDVRLRRWDGARAVFYIVDYKNSTSLLPKFTGDFGRIVLSEKGKAIIEVQGLGNKTVSLGADLYSMTCRNSLGDRLCMKNIEVLRADFTVIAVADDFTFTASDLNGQPDGYYSLGQMAWDTGANTGQIGEVQTSHQLTNEIGLFYPPSAPITIGDTGHIYPGCDLLVQTCLAKFDNVLNFNGEPFNIQPSIPTAAASTGSTVTLPAGAAFWKG